MFFGGSARRDRAGAGVVLIPAEQIILPFSFVIGETCSNNVAEYQDLIVGLEIVLDRIYTIYVSTLTFQQENDKRKKIL